MKNLNALSAILLVVGGVNWGLVGLFKFDLVATLFGSGSLMSRLVYTLVGLSAAFQATQLTSQSTKRGMELEIGRR